MATYFQQALLRKPEVIKRLGISNSTFYARIRDGSFPPGVPVGPRLKAWPANEVQKFIDNCITSRDVALINKAKVSK